MSPDNKLLDPILALEPNGAQNELFLQIDPASATLNNHRTIGSKYGITTYAHSERPDLDNVLEAWAL
mgnify:CR=1 FL=1